MAVCCGLPLLLSAGALGVLAGIGLGTWPVIAAGLIAAGLIVAGLIVAGLIVAAVSAALRHQRRSQPARALRALRHP